MTHYYDNHAYTPEQAEHANRVVLDLIKTRRFFLHNPNAKSFYNLDYGLHPDVFREAIDLDGHLRELYTNARNEAIANIVSGEKNLGITPPNLENNRQMVVCNRYGGGFEICRVYPLTVFATVAPKNIDDLRAEHLNLFIAGQSLDEIAPKTMREYEDCAESLAMCIWQEFGGLEVFNSLNHRCVVLLESKFDCSGRGANNDFANSRVADMQQTPFALGYLFWKFSQETRIIQHHHVVFNTSRISHVNMQHWSGENIPKIRYDAKHGYDCPVMFATAL
ncbi:MAG: hypothetical protein HGB03_02845 [Candidatus Yonathbacteria bacterium]|nr:hypothetical protein [Candidatus Yonathbacteria bacterium]NTW47428.1 hypothetical protein [Candidatus Yonathbacteria bacterium]